ncbi:hypothetical protein ACW14Y_42545 (plasmid) [Kitasatospora sp. cg17-2]
MPPSALHALADLLDRSFARIADAAVDARTLDRQLIHRETNPWRSYAGDHVLPLFTAASSRPAPAGEWLARRALRRMGESDSEQHAWVSELPGAAGLLGAAPAVDPTVPERGWDGELQPPAVQALGRAALAPYDPAAARFTGLSLESVPGGVDASVGLELPRRYAVNGPERQPARMAVRLTGVTLSAFEGGRGSSGELGWSTDEGRTEVLVGGHGRLVAERSEFRNGDWYWHDSEEGLAAALLYPPVPEGRRERRRARRRNHWTDRAERWPLPLDRSSHLAAALVRQALARASLGACADRNEQRAVLDVCRVFRGAGTDVLAAGRLGGKGFRALIHRWAELGGDPMANWFANVLHGNSGTGPAGAWGRRLALELSQRPWPTAAGLPALPRAAALRLLTADFEGIRLHRQPGTAVLQFALPPRDGGGRREGWDLLTVVVEGITRLRVTPGAFAEPGRVDHLNRRRHALEWGSSLCVSWHPKTGLMRTVGQEPEIRLVGRSDG